MEVRKVQSFRDLGVWREGHKLVIMVYEFTKTFPKEESFGIVSQLMRAAVSITSNIAEGFSRHGIKEKVQFYSMAHGSLTEIENQLIISKDVGYLSSDTFNKTFEQLVLTHKLLNGLISRTKARQNPAS